MDNKVIKSITKNVYKDVGIFISGVEGQRSPGSIKRFLQFHYIIQSKYSMIPHNCNSRLHLYRFEISQVIGQPTSYSDAM